MVLSAMKTQTHTQTHAERRDAATAGLRLHTWQQDQTEEPTPCVSGDCIG